MVNDVDLLAQYLIAGDLLGFIVGTYTTRLGQLFWAIISFFPATWLGIKTQSVIYPMALWLLLGGLFLVAMPIVSPVAVVLIILAIGAMFFRAFFGREQ